MCGEEDRLPRESGGTALLHALQRASAAFAEHQCQCQHTGKNIASVSAKQEVLTPTLWMP